MARFIALLDANVLWPISLCDILLRAAEAALYQPAWSKDILGELVSSLMRERPELDPDRIKARVADMRDHFPEAMTAGYEALMPAMLNEPGDHHVLAAAIHAHAAVIVTDNVRDFPPLACDPYGIDVQTADDFLCHLWHLDPTKMARIVQEAADALKNPPKNPEELIAILSRTRPVFAHTVTESGRLGQ